MNSNDSTSSDWSLLGKLLPFMKKDRALYILALLAAPVSALLVIAQPYLLKVAIDDYILANNAHGLQRIALFYLGAVVLGFIFESAYTLTVSYAAMRTITRLRDAVYEHTLGMARSFFDREPTGKLLTRATSDVDALGETLTAGAITIVLDVILVLGILTAMFILDAKLTLVMLLVSPFLGFAIDRIRRVLRKLYLKVRTSLATLNSFLTERLNGVQVVQLYSDEERTMTAFDERLYAYRDATIRTNVWDALLYALVDGLTSVCMAIMLWYGGMSTLEGAITAGLLAAFIDYVGKLFQPIREFSAKLAVIQRALSALVKIFGLLEHKEEIEEGDAQLSGPLESIVFKDVSFRYAEEGSDVLKEVSLELYPGEVVAVVGRTGSGKSTLAKLLIRAYQGHRGEILINGLPIESLSLADVRRTIGMVHQDTQLFPGDVRFNLALGHDVSDDALWEAIRQARAEKTVEALGGLDGHIEHQGANLSVGEGQLLNFARTIAFDPSVIILDEATASVDSITEAAIQEATQVVLERKTVLVIAHRLSTIINSDRIAVMDAGQIIEMGSHSELMAKGGHYAELFDKQFDEGLESTSVA